MKLILSEDRDGWRWWLVASNSRLVSCTLTAYRSERSARRAFNDMHAALATSYEPHAPHRRVVIGSAKIPAIVVRRDLRRDLERQRGKRRKARR